MCVNQIKHSPRSRVLSDRWPWWRDWRLGLCRRPVIFVRETPSARVWRRVPDQLNMKRRWHSHPLIKTLVKCLHEFQWNVELQTRGHVTLRRVLFMSTRGALLLRGTVGGQFRSKSFLMSVLQLFDFPYDHIRSSRGVSITKCHSGPDGRRCSGAFFFWKC